MAMQSLPKLKLTFWCCYRKETEKRNQTCSLPHNRHLSQPTQSMIRETFLKWSLNSSCKRNTLKIGNLKQIKTYLQIIIYRSWGRGTYSFNFFIKICLTCTCILHLLLQKRIKSKIRDVCFKLSQSIHCACIIIFSSKNAHSSKFEPDYSSVEQVSIESRK